MYKFDNKNHIHLLDNKPLHGVTSVLKVISKPALIQWAANMACDYIQKEIQNEIIKQEGKEGIPALDFDKIFKEARMAHRKKKEAGGDWGHIVHDAIEQWIKTGINPKLAPVHLIAFENFKTWATENKVEFLESEKHLYSKELWLGGICDMVFKMDGKKYIGDIKTSSAIYNEHFFQMAAYALMLEDMGEHKDIDGYMVINLKKTGEIDCKIAYDMTLNKEAFKAALTLHKIIETLQ